MTDVTRISTKGQVVIPQDLRDALGLEAGAAMAVERVDDCLILKKIQIPNLALEFKRAQRRLRGAAKKAGLSGEQDVIDLVREFRQTHGKALRKAVARK
jgi:antitoxin PrlF